MKKANNAFLVGAAILNPPTNLVLLSDTGQKEDIKVEADWLIRQWYFSKVTWGGNYRKVCCKFAISGLYSTVWKKCSNKRSFYTKRMLYFYRNFFQCVLEFSFFVHNSSINEHKKMKLRENICYERINWTMYYCGSGNNLYTNKNEIFL